MSLRIARTTPALRRMLAPLRARGKSVGFVPTMGALHAGHASLVRASKAACDATVVSIFVNPTQFGPTEDFSRYPRDLRLDCGLLRTAGADIVFAPSASAMYPEGSQTFVDQTDLPRGLCGAFRPGHFRGVMTVVLKLFNIVAPDVAFFGRKDYQQATIVRRMVRDLDLPVRIRVMPTVRENDGLAMSSRNRYLSPVERRRALSLWRALSDARRRVRTGERSAARLVRAMSEALHRMPGAKIDYVAVVDPDTLQPVRAIRRRAVALLAVRIGKTRLIDNMDLRP